MMGNGNSTNSTVKECAMHLSRFREAHAAYEAASDAEKESLFASRHASLMLALSTPPQSHDEICGLMRIALGELAKNGMFDGPVPRAIATALANCLRAIEFAGDKIRVHEAVASPLPAETPTNLDSQITKLDRFAGLLRSLAESSGGKDAQAVFFALMNGIEAIRDSLLVVSNRSISTPRPMQSLAQ